MNQHVFRTLRFHLTKILDMRRIFTYRGARMSFIDTIDNIYLALTRKNKIILTKYDCSNAFGTLHPGRFEEILHQLNISQPTIDFILGYLRNQASARTIVQDPLGFYMSKTFSMTRGTPRAKSEPT